jgi:hypothetical protein
MVRRDSGQRRTMTQGMLFVLKAQMAGTRESTMTPKQEVSSMVQSPLSLNSKVAAMNQSCWNWQAFCGVYKCSDGQAYHCAAKLVK